MADFGPYVDGVADLTPSAEQEFQRAVERCGGYEVDPDAAKRCSAAANFQAECEMVLETVWASRITA